MFKLIIYVCEINKDFCIDLCIIWETKQERDISTGTEQFICNNFGRYRVIHP